MCQIMMPSKFLKPEESSKLLQDQHFKTHVLSDYIYFTPHPRPRWDPRTPDWSKKNQYSLCSENAEEMASCEEARFWADLNQKYIN